MGDTSVTVNVRIRPLLAHELEDSPDIVWKYSHDSIVLDSVLGKKQFGYDRVFGTEADNMEVYNQFAKPVIDNIMIGYNGTLFAYGQTSSGKTYTITGPESNGILFLGVRDIFARVEDSLEDFMLRISYFEIYQNRICDLLQPKGRGNNLKILRDDPDRGAIIENLIEELVFDSEQVEEIIERGEQNRHYGFTNINEHSSRSHTVFRMVVESKPTEASLARDTERLKRIEEQEGGTAVPETGWKSISTGKETSNSDINFTRVSCLNIVDLAGSERQTLAKSEGVRLKEGSSINRSLMTLSLVINKLSTAKTKGDYIPFRDCKLTRVLRQGLGGNSYTGVLCTVSPASMCQQDTLGTLKFGRMCKDLKTVAVRPNLVADDKSMLKLYRLTIQDLKDKLQEKELRLLQERETLQADAEAALEAKMRASALEQEVERLQRLMSPNRTSQSPSMDSVSPPRSPPDPVATPVFTPPHSAGSTLPRTRSISIRLHQGSTMGFRISTEDPSPLSPIVSERKALHQVEEEESFIAVADGAEERIRELEEELADAEAKLVNLTRVLSQREQQHSSLNEELCTIRSEMEQVERREMGLELRLSNATNRSEELEDALSVQNEERERLEKAVLCSQAREVALRDSLARLQSNEELRISHEKHQQELQLQLEQSASSKEELRISHEKHQQECSALQSASEEKVEELQMALHKAAVKINQKEDEIFKLEQTVKSERFLSAEHSTKAEIVERSLEGTRMSLSEWNAQLDRRAEAVALMEESAAMKEEDLHCRLAIVRQAEERIAQVFSSLQGVDVGQGVDLYLFLEEHSALRWEASLQFRFQEKGRVLQAQLTNVRKSHLELRQCWDAMVRNTASETTIFVQQVRDHAAANQALLNDQLEELRKMALKKQQEASKLNSSREATCRELQSKLEQSPSTNKEEELRLCDELESRLQVANTALASLEKEHGELSAAHSALKEHDSVLLADWKSQVEALTETKDSLKSGSAALQSSYDAVLEELQSERNDLALVKEELSATAVELAAAETSLEDAELKIAELEKGKADSNQILGQRCDELESRLHVANTALASLEKEHGELSAAHSALKEHDSVLLADWKSQVEALTETNDSLKSGSAALQSSFDAVLEELQSERNDLALVKEELSATAVELAAAETSLEDAELKIAELEKGKADSNQILGQRCDELESRLQVANTALASLEKEHGELSAAHSALKEHDSVLLADWKSQVEALTETNDSLKSDSAALQSSFDAVLEELQSERNDLALVKEELSATAVELAAAETSLEDAELKIAELEKSKEVIPTLTVDLARDLAEEVKEAEPAPTLRLQRARSFPRRFFGSPAQRVVSPVVHVPVAKISLLEQPAPPVPVETTGMDNLAARDAESILEKLSITRGRARAGSTFVSSSLAFASEMIAEK